ncbi:TMAO reductase system periplasmic protein TorT [Parasalinivibrio latis]|uniref:TMAO reductase system periplasmic protein TorT n=1 Tax=Parasalinivibrio latis TaxID=2952610 RepID=UPI0030E3B25F
MRTIAFLAFVLVFYPAKHVLAHSHPEPIEKIEIDVWDPPFENAKQAQTSDYIFLKKTAKKWRICASIPHLKDAYWLAVNYGLVQRASNLKLKIEIFSAGGYDKLARQRQQLQDCLRKDVDALIVSAVSTTDLNDIFEAYRKAGKPVIDLINGIDSPSLSARVAADFSQMARNAANYVTQMNTGKTMSLLWLPGPKDAGWSQAGDRAFKEAVAPFPINISSTLWGDTGFYTQYNLIKEGLSGNPKIDFIVGNAVAVEAALKEVRKLKSPYPGIISYYFSPGVYRAMLRGYVQASPTDNPGYQAQLAVDLAVRLLEKIPGTPKHISAKIELLTADTIRDANLDGSLAPPGFVASFSVN